MASFLIISAAQQVGSLLAEEGKFLYKVHDKIKKLQTELEWMECFLEDADKRQHQEKVVCKWVAEITEFAYEAENIIERYLHEVSDQQRDDIWDTIKWFSKILCTCRAGTLHSLGSDIDELILKVLELNRRLESYGIKFTRPTESLAYNVRMREERQTYSHVEEEAFGLDGDVQQVVSQLIGEQVNVVSIYGMGGLGKSTLAKKVFGDNMVKKYFKNNCVWVYISKEFSRRNVFEEILIGLSVSAKGEGARKNIKDLTDQELAKEIYELLQNKKCLVVLDDMWTTEAWKSLKPALVSVKGSPSKILLTTRNHALLQYVDFDGYSHPLKPLNEEDSWKLLQSKAFPQRSKVESSVSTQNRQNELQVDTEEKAKKEKLGRKMLKHCHGVPLAIIALGGILFGKRELGEWEEVLQNISTYMANIGDKEISPVLELSYDDLPFYLKPCFLYLASFPEDYEISTERLYRLWEAEGILAVSTKVDAQAQGASTTFDLGERYLVELIQRSMVQVGKRWASSQRINTCRVHDLMRDVAIKKCEEVSFLNVKEYSKFDLQTIFVDCSDERKRMHRCALHVNEVVAESHLFTQYGGKAPFVRSLLVFLLKQYPRKVEFGERDLANMVKCFPLLRVLDLQDTGIGYWPSKEYVHLIHLRYLSLKNSYSQTFTSYFPYLKYLVTLDLRQVCVKKLANKFHRMKRLRHLCLPRSFDLEDGQRLSFRDLQLETLKNFDLDKCEMKDLLLMTSLRIFSISRRYTFRCGDDLKALAETPVIKSGHQMANSLHLRIKAEVIEEDPSIVTSLLSSANPRLLTKLELWGEGKSVVALHNMESAIERGIQVFPSSLTKLIMYGCEVGREFVSFLEKLPHLEELRLVASVRMGNKISFSDGSFPQLRLLALQYLNDLEEWEVGEGALPTLQRLQIICCQKLEKLPDGLPDSVNIKCFAPCIKGIEKYNTCPHFKGVQSYSLMS